jgi:hypothetical protein
MIARESNPRARRRAWASAALLGGLAGIVAAVVFAPWGCGGLHGGEARVVRLAVRQWRSVANSTACPAYGELVNAGLLDPGVSRSAGSDFRIDCQDGVLVVWSGSDQKFGTPDDETAPDPLGSLPPMTISRLGAAALDLLLVPVSLCGIAILATLRRTPWAAAARRVAAIVGWLAILGCLCAGYLDMNASRQISARPGLSGTDAERCRRRGNQNFLNNAGLGIVLGAPGAVLVPFPRRRRVSRGGNRPSSK